MLEPGCTAVSFSSPKPQRGSGAHPADVIRNFRKSDGAGFQSSAQKHHRVLRCLSLEVILRFDERETRHMRDSGDGFRGETGGRIETRAYGRAAQRKFVQTFDREGNPVDRIPDLVRVAAEFLPHAHGNGILQVRTADLDHVVELARFPAEFALQKIQAHQQTVRNSLDSGDVHCRWKDVVARLPPVHIVVRMTCRSSSAAGAQ